MHCRLRDLIATLMLAIVAVAGCSNGQGAKENPTVSQTQSNDPQAALRAKPSFEQAQLQYRNTVLDWATRIAALVPGLTWQVKEDSWRGCGGEYVDTPGVQVYFYVVFSGPIPDETWPHAVGIVKNGAATLGALDMTTLADKPGDRDVTFGGPDGIEVEFGTKVATILSAKSDCRIRDTDR